jgi:hypothetical protein
MGSHDKDIAAAAIREEKRARLEELELEEKLKKNIISKTKAQP